MRKRNFIFAFIVLFACALLVSCAPASKGPLPFERGETDENFLPFEVNQKNVRLAVGKQADVKKNITLYANKLNFLSFKSEDVDVVTVDSNGIIAAHKEGDTEIVIDYEEGKFQKDERISVKVVDIDIEIESIKMPVVKLSESVVPEIIFNDQDAGFGIDDVDFFVKTGNEYLEYRGNGEFLAVGVGVGVIKASMKRDPALFVEQDFETNFADTNNVGQEIRSRLGKPIGYITKSDLELVTEINLGGNNLLRTSNDIVTLKNLEKINLNNTYNASFNDYSFIAKLTRLEDINLSGNRITDVSFLSANVNLRNLDLSSNSIQTVTALPNITNIQTLNLKNNRLTAFSFLSNATQLKVLDISGNQAAASEANVAFLQYLINTQHLNIAGNTRITSLSYLAGKTELEYLNANSLPLTAVGNLSAKLKYIDIYGNRMTNLNFLSNCKQIQYLDIGLESGNNTRITSILPLEGITTLTRFLAPGNGITSLEPIKNSTNLRVLDVANNDLNPTNTMTTTAVLTGFANLEELYIGGNTKLNNIDFLNTATARNNLKRLNIGELNISATLVENYVSQLSKLEWLQLYKLNLTSCVFLGFANLPNLRYLKISHNSITNFLPVMHVSVLVTDYNDIRQD